MKSAAPATMSSYGTHGSPSAPPRSHAGSALNLRLNSSISSHSSMGGVDGQSPTTMQPYSQSIGYPVRTPSLATLARELAQEIQQGRTFETNSPVTPHHKYREMDEMISMDEVTSEHGNESGESDLKSSYNMYNVYNTYESTYRPYETYDNEEEYPHKAPLCPPFPAGIIRFILQDSEESSKDRYYMTVMKDSSMDDVARFMAVAWRRRTPKLVLSIISSSQYYVPWSKPKFEEAFQAGLIQAANSTEMWILTEGLDLGVSKLIGDAAHREMMRRRNIAQNPLHIQNIMTEERLPRLNIFGICTTSSLIYADAVSGGKVQTQTVMNSGGKPNLKLYDLNPDHTHFLLLDDGQVKDMEGLYNLRLSLEMRLTKPVGKPRRYNHMSSDHSLHMLNVPESTVERESMLTPVIGLLVQGGPPDIDHILWLLKKQIPVVVIQGSGLAADLVSFAFSEMEQNSDPAYLDSYIKAELMRRVSDAFPDDFVNDDIARNLCRDRIIECVKLNYQNNLSFLTIVKSDSQGTYLNDISKYLLMALFKSQARMVGRHWREQLQWDLQLTLDWNRPDLARTQIFNKYNLKTFAVAEYVVHLALLRPNREEFIELFLEHGLMIHSYLNHKRLHNLFENPADKDFFVTVCMEGVLGKAVNPFRTLTGNFVEDTNCDLNRLLYKCTGLQNLINPYELSMNSLGSYVTDKDVAERRATNTLVLWAALTNRYRLAKLLWKRTEDPMAVALIISMILHRLGTEWCKKDLDMRHRVKDTAAEFGKMAVSLLSLSYQDSSVYTFSALSKKLEDFNNRTVVELAKLGENKYFIAHPCCQKWLTQRWYGKINIRELDWGGQFSLPDGLKIYLSVFFVFPMFFWISFQPTDSKNRNVEDDEDVQDEAQEMSMLLRVTSMEEKMSRRRKKSRMKVTFQNMMKRPEGHRVPFCKKIYYLWSAPVTKFWLCQLLYFCYLMVMSTALLMPGCGIFMLNLLVFSWTFTIFIEVIRRTYLKKKLYPEVPVMWNVVECIMVGIYLVVMLVLRVLPHFVQYVSFMTTKFLLSIYLLFFYFRFMALTLPVSPTLGPMMVSVVAMTRKDFCDWMRLFFMVLVSGAVTIQAVIYPSYPFGVDSLRQAFSRAIFGLFLTKIDDLDGKDCSPLFDDPQVKYCHGPRYTNADVQKNLSTCPHGSLLNYVIVIPYLLNAKLIFITLLFAMFAATTAKVYNESIEIWKYQRYGMIVDFEERLVLPPPLSLLCYAFFILKWIGRFIYRIVAAMCAHTPCFGPSRDYKDHASKIQIVKFRRTSDYNYWKECIQLYTEKEKAQKIEDERAKVQSNSIARLLEQMEHQRLMSRQLNDRMVQLETNFTSTCLLLEEMKHMIKRMDPATKILHQEPKKLIHIFARQSPYKNTMIRRFPVFDKYVPWEIPYDQYDPGIFSKPVSQYSEEMRRYIDPDVLELIEEQNRRQGLSVEELEELPPLVEFNPVYNTVMSCTIDGVHLEIDRTSWITTDNQPLRYKLDTLSIPLNPLGRTGLRGRGNLWRFGPNHRIAAVVTRWRRKYTAFGFSMEYMLVDGKRVLECVIVTKPDTAELTLPGGNVYGKTTAYSVMCEEFMRSVFGEEEVEGSLKLDQDDMISYFAQFARTPESGQFHLPGMDMAMSGFSASILYRGYIDDIANTDNAWREAEVWNFHYDLGDIFDEKIKERAHMWREITPFMRLYGNQDSIVMEAARIHNACH